MCFDSGSPMVKPDKPVGALTGSVGFLLIAVIVVTCIAGHSPFKRSFTAGTKFDRRLGRIKLDRKPHDAGHGHRTTTCRRRHWPFAQQPL